MRRELERSLRGLDQKALQDFETERVQAMDELTEKRAVLKQKEREEMELKKKEQADKREADEIKKVEKAKKDELKKNQLLVDRDWAPTDFGSCGALANYGFRIAWSTHWTGVEIVGEIGVPS